MLAEITLRRRYITESFWQNHRLRHDIRVEFDDASTRSPNLVYLYTQRVKFQGFISSDYSDQLPQFYEGMRTWIEEGRVKWKETILEGIENAA